ILAPVPLPPAVLPPQQGQGPGELQPRAGVPVRRAEPGGALQRDPSGAPDEQRGPRVPPRGPPEGGARGLPPGRDVPTVLPAGRPAPANPRERDVRGPAPGPEGSPGDARDHAEGASPNPRPPAVHLGVP